MVPWNLESACPPGLGKGGLQFGSCFSHVLIFRQLSLEQMVWQQDLGLWDDSQSQGRRKGFPSSEAFKAATSL